MNKRIKFIFFLMACLMPLAMVAQQTHWTPQGAAYEDNMTLTGVIQINGVEQQSAALEVGAFCGTECRGAVRAVLFPATQRYVVMLTIFGNNGDQITFKLYDHNQGMELNYQSPSAVIFGSNGLGTLMNPYVLNFTSPVYTISASASPSAGGTISGAGTYPSGSTCTLTATPATGYSFVRWTKNGSQVSTNPSYSFTVTGNASYVAVFSLNSYTISASSSPSAGGSVSGTGSYNYGSTCTLTATPATGYSFVRWTKNASQVSTNPSYSFTVTENASYVAVFSLNSYTISASASPSEGGSVSGAGSYNYGTTCNLTATPATGYSFVRWTKNGSQVSTNASYSFTVTENASYVAVFSLNSYTISASASPSAGGTVSGAGSYNYGTTCNLTATPATGYSFVRWTKNGTQVSTNASYSFTVTENASYVAVFSLNNYTISASASPSAGGTVSGAGNYQQGSTCTVSATANAGYTFDNWTENGTVVSAAATYTFEVTASHTLVANFVDATGTGKLSGVFSVGEHAHIQFSQGNLQYQASTNTWRFATNQYDCIGSANSNISQSYSGWIDLFGWGTSGYNHGASCYQPWSTSTTNSDYYAYGQSAYNLYDQTGQADWGYNAIINGGNTENNGWRTLTNGSGGEWNYVLNMRSTSSGIRYAKAQVNGVNGVILLPDDWNASYYSLSNTNSGDASFDSNVISSTQWNTLEQHGAVFLPAAGNRSGASVNYVGSYGYYWSASDYNGYNACCVIFDDNPLAIYNATVRYRGLSVRLVCPAENYSFGINASPSPAVGGTVSGGGTYQEGATCTLTATANTGYTFINWTENGEVVSTEATYSFVVTGTRDIVANFIPMLTSISDDFNDGVIAPELWLATGNNVYEEDGLLKMDQNVTDQNVSLLSVPMSVGVDNKIVMERSFMVHRGSNYAYPGFAIEFNGDTGIHGRPLNAAGWDGTTANTSGVNYIGVVYGHTAYEGKYGIYVEEGIGDEIQGTRLCDAIFDTWLTEIVVIDLSAGTFTYYLNDNYVAAVEMPELSTLDVDYYTTIFSPWGWWTGHQQYMDHININLSGEYVVTVSADPSEGGTVSSGGNFEFGDNCTVSATANEGYTFINWTENGEVVSTEATYRFTVMRDRILVANFVDENSCAITFDLYDSYGDGYTGNYLVVSYGDVTEQLTVESGSFASHVLYIPDESHVELSWIQGDYPGECSFTISYSNGNWIYHSTNLNNSFSFGFDVDCEGMPVILYSINASANPSEYGTVSLETDFESQQIPSNWINDATYPWVVTTPEYSGYNGSFCMMSGNGGVHSSTSSIEVTVDFIQDGTISFLAGCWGEGSDVNNWDKCRFCIDGINMMDYGAHRSWENVSFDVTAGNHTFTWTYKKDGSVHPAGDAFFVDDIKFAGASIGSQFIYGQTCTTTATPTEDYQFYCWKENGNVVSTEANYSFTVIADRNLEGVFGPPLSVSVTSNLGIGGMVSGGGVFDYGTTCTVTATPNEGYLFLNWSRNGEVLSCNANYSFTVTEPIALEAVFMHLNGRLVGAGDATNQYLPSFSYYCYTLSQQIYTPDEIGAAGSILTLSYFNAGETKTRSYDIYMVHTDKSTFENNTDWITVTEADRVFSGEVTMTRGYWNTILLDTPFDYDGTSNLAIVVDDNSGNWSSNHMYCRVFNANGSQAIRVYSDGTNYDPYNPSGYGGTLHSVKNQMIFGVMPAYHFVTAGTWGNAANWSGGALPGAGDAVFIDANCALNRDAEVAMLSITPGNTLTLRTGKTLSVPGILFNTYIEGLVIEDGAQLVNTSNNVAATVKKNVQAYNNSNPDGWYTISSPMNGMSIAGSSFVTPEYDLYRFNETNLTHDEWENYKANLADFTTFEKGRGYLYANSNTLAPAFTGILNNMDVTYTLTCTERPNDPLSGFNLIGNPFPHEIYKGAGGAIDNVNLASGYYTLTNEGTWEVHSFDDAIQPGQGILVKATAPTVLTIAKSSEEAFSESGDVRGLTERMCISVAGDNGQDRTYVYFGQGFGLDKKNDFDAQVPNLWIRNNGHDYAIAHVEDTDESLELCFSNRLEGDFTLAIKLSDMEFEYLQLIDCVTGVTVDLLKQSVYTFHSERNEGTKRFTLAFKKK